MDNHNIEMQDEYDFSQARRGPIVPPAPGQTKITIRIDNDVLNWFRLQVEEAGGGSYQAAINKVLYEYVASREPIIDRIRQMIANGEMSWNGKRLPDFDPVAVNESDTLLSDIVSQLREPNEE